MARYNKKIDAKGRIFIPSKLRDVFGQTVVVTLSLDQGYLSAYTEERFERIRAQFEGLNSMDPKVRRVTRLIIGEALRCDLDSQGRISVSAALWDHIGATSSEEVCMVDLGDKIDICTRKYYEQEKDRLSSIMELDLTAYNVTGL